MYCPHTLECTMRCEAGWEEGRKVLPVDHLAVSVFPPLPRLLQRPAQPV